MNISAVFGTSNVEERMLRRDERVVYEVRKEATYTVLMHDLRPKVQALALLG
jgi:hypothetical protein